MMELSDLKQVVQVWAGLADRSNNLRELVQLALDEEDDSLVDSLTSDINDVEQELSDKEFDLLLSGPNDERSAILAVHAGAGGTESQDWAQMLLRMYLRWAERAKYSASIIDASPGDEAGIKSAYITLKVNMLMAI